MVRNDHRDAAYDAGVVADLARLNEDAGPVVEQLAGALDRYATYGPQLRRAVEKVEAGQGDWFTRPMFPSYHSVWFELHEDLLTTLGVERSDEAAS
jgi:pyruvate,orthophosphate dikinase